jgi:RNA polymerase sigma-70 factor (ECF subfamily)
MRKKMAGGLASGYTRLMPDPSFSTHRLQRYLDQIQDGDRTAQEELLRRVGGRLERLARKMLRRFPGVHRWTETGDVLQNATLRLLRALREVRPANTREFFSLAAEHMRRELLDLSRHFYGPQGLGAHHASRGGHQEDPSATWEPRAPGVAEELERWGLFHEAVAQLPVEEREVFGLVFYHGWTQPQIAALFQMSERTIRRYWQSACLRLTERVGGKLPQP